MDFCTKTSKLRLNRQESERLFQQIVDLAFAAQFPCPNSASLAQAAKLALEAFSASVVHPAPPKQRISKAANCTAVAAEPETDVAEGQ